MKIGFFIKGIEYLNYWELRLMSDIMEDSRYELSVLLIDSLPKTESPSHLKISIGEKLFRIQSHIESKFLFKTIQSVNKESVLRKLSSIRKITLFTSNPSIF